MIVPQVVEQWYSNALPSVARLSEKVKASLLRFCEENGFAFQSRVKTIESLAEKLETGRYKEWDDIDDIFACTVIVPSIAREQIVLDFLSAAFIQLRVRKRGDVPKDPATFRFDSTRFVGRLRDLQSQEFRSEIVRFSFEVQIRTAFEHAWAVATHDFSYKADRVDWRRLRLTAQLRALSEQADVLLLGLGGATENVPAHPWPEIGAQRAFADFFERSIGVSIPLEARPKDLSRLCGNCVALLRASRHTSGFEIDKRAAEAIDRLDQEAMKIGIDLFPRSLTLWQWVFAVLASANIVNPPLMQFCPFITEPMINMYPSTGKFEQRFGVEYAFV